MGFATEARLLERKVGSTLATLLLAESDRALEEEAFNIVAIERQTVFCWSIRSSHGLGRSCLAQSTFSYAAAGKENMTARGNTTHTLPYLPYLTR